MNCNAISPVHSKRNFLSSKQKAFNHLYFLSVNFLTAEPDEVATVQGEADNLSLTGGFTEPEEGCLSCLDAEGASSFPFGSDCASFG